MKGVARESVSQAQQYRSHTLWVVNCAIEVNNSLRVADSFTKVMPIRIIVSSTLRWRNFSIAGEDADLSVVEILYCSRCANLILISFNSVGPISCEDVEFHNKYDHAIYQYLTPYCSALIF